jgi:CelD/BcsL family acetyltransferase involved in cellulose biosynthesis
MPAGSGRERGEGAQERRIRHPEWVVRLEIVDPGADPAWSDLVDRDPAASIFHHPGWLRLLGEQYRYPISAWCVTGPEGRLTAGLPVALVRSRLTGSRLISIPFSDTCAPLRDPASELDAATLPEGIEEQRVRAGLPLEVRGEIPGVPGGMVVQKYAQHRLALEPDVEQVERRFAKSQVKRGIAKAVREGVTVARHQDRDALARFYAMHLATRRHQGVPTQPRRFILRFSELFGAGHGFVLLARHQGRDVAGAVFLAAGSTLTYKYGASRRDALAVRPNNLLFMEAIRWGCEHGMRTLDFGRTDLDNDGLMAFKRSWGADELPLAYTYLGRRKPESGPGLSQRAMKTVIQHSPPALGRLVGEALYRDFA